MRNKFSIALLLLITAATAGTLGAAEARTASRQVTFNKDVLPIFQENCQSCHRPGQIAPMSLLTYQDARPWAKSIKLKVAERQMPPWNADPHYGHFSNDRSLNKDQIETILAWVDQ